MESDSFSVYHSREEKSDGYVDKNSNATEEQSSLKRLKLGQSDKCMWHLGSFLSYFIL